MRLYSMIGSSVKEFLLSVRALEVLGVLLLIFGVWALMGLPTDFKTVGTLSSELGAVWYTFMLLVCFAGVGLIVVGRKVVKKPQRPVYGKVRF